MTTRNHPPTPIRRLSGREKSAYERPVASTRVGPSFDLHSYPTRINPAAIVPFILAHTSPGDLVLDAFGGSGSTGVAASLAGVAMSRRGDLGVPGARRAFLTDIGVLPVLIGSVTLDPPDPNQFEEAARAVLRQLTDQCGWMYATHDSGGGQAELRHAVWTEHLICARCGRHTRFWDSAVSIHPPAIGDRITCECGHVFRAALAERVTEDYFDSLTKQSRRRRIRSLAWIYGVSDGKTWQRAASNSDADILTEIPDEAFDKVPIVEVLTPGTMELYRSGYHFGLRYLHDFYTRRNLAAISSAWQLVTPESSSLQHALRLWVSSYNVTHSTIMTRIVAKRDGKELVVTGAQPAALYVSSIPVEKNVLRGLERKLTSFTKAFRALRSMGNSKSTYVMSSAINLPLADHSVDYVFIDPPFGDNIQYAEIHRLAEAWLGRLTDPSAEIIVSKATGKSVARYGSLMTAAFREFHRVLKPGACMTLVFHSSQTDVWLAVEAAWRDAGFELSATSTLTKTQGSFKQVTTSNAVSQDLVILLERKGSGANEQLTLVNETPFDIVDALTEYLDGLPISGPGAEQRSKQALYSFAVAAALRSGAPLEVGAATFYEMLASRFEWTRGLYFSRDRREANGERGYVGAGTAADAR